MPVLFIAQVALSAVAITTSIVMISLNRNATLYIPIISGVLGYWLPQPRAPPEISRVVQSTLFGRRASIDEERPPA